ncbi:MAG: DUF1015 domain-containing protein [Burkholderiales bacterium]|nr:DUF1015 domain-containing protein [Burkholderiales bacterium]
MNAKNGFRSPQLCLPAAGIDLRKWAVVACDQYTSEPEYWEAVEREVGDAPSTLRLIYPEVHLAAADKAARIEAIQATMRDYLARGLLADHKGAVYVERQVGGRTRRGLMLELDLEHYDFDARSASLIRPTEGTIVERIAPRVAVRRGAALELPHVMVLIDDPQGTVIEPLAQERDALAPLYDIELMAGGGHLRGMAVDAARWARVAAALDALAEPAAFARHYGVPEGTPVMLFPVGDGNHSLATAKATWNEIKPGAGADHPARFALVEVVNIHDPALQFEPIHRLLFGVTADLRQAMQQTFGAALRCADVPTAAAMREQVGTDPRRFGVIGPGARCSVAELEGAPASLALDALQPFVDGLLADKAAADIDYVHGDDVLERLAQQPGNVGLHLPTIAKGELLRRVVHKGPLPRKTFSLGEAHEKRYYVEARRIVPA